MELALPTRDQLSQRPCTQVGTPEQSALPSSDHLGPDVLPSRSLSSGQGPAGLGYRAECGGSAEPFGVQTGVHTVLGRDKVQKLLHWGFSHLGLTVPPPLPLLELGTKDFGEAGVPSISRVCRLPFSLQPTPSNPWMPPLWAHRTEGLELFCSYRP